jgi:hypothetical protein
MPWSSHGMTKALKNSREDGLPKLWGRRSRDAVMSLSFVMPWLDHGIHAATSRSGWQPLDTPLSVSTVRKGNGMDAMVEPWHDEGEGRQAKRPGKIRRKSGTGGRSRLHGLTK